MESNGTWDEELRRGNPTKCRQINRLITAVKKKETRRLGKASNADRAFDDDEFSQLVNLLGTQGRLVNRRRFQAMVKFQVHLIGRSDDMAHIQKCSNLKESSQFSGFLSVKMRWSTKETVGAVQSSVSQNRSLRAPISKNLFEFSPS